MAINKTETKYDNTWKWRVQDICTRPSTCAWDKQQIDSDRLCNKGKSLVCFTATEVTIDRDDKTC